MAIEVSEAMNSQTTAGAGCQGSAVMRTPSWSESHCLCQWPTQQNIASLLSVITHVSQCLSPRFYEFSDEIKNISSPVPVMWLGLSIVLYTKMLQVQSPVRTCTGGNLSIFLFHIDVSISNSLSFSNILRWRFKKEVSRTLPACDTSQSTVFATHGEQDRPGPSSRELTS